MRKADSLRRWLTACIPAFKTHPDRLMVFLDEGSIASRKSRTLSFEYRYTAAIVITDWSGDTDALTIPVLAWIEREQPQLLSRQDSQPFTFKAELLDSDTADIQISIDLTESVVVTMRPDGSGYDAEHKPEPSFADSFDGVGAATIRQGFASIEGELADADPAPGPPPPP